MPLGKMEQALQGGRNKCFYKTTSRPRFYAELHFIIEGKLGESWTGVCHCIYICMAKTKRQYIFTEAKQQHCFKANQEFVMKCDTQEIKESCTLSLNHEFCAADASCP